MICVRSSPRYFWLLKLTWRLPSQWVTLNDSLVFLGLHFVIGQCEFVALSTKANRYWSRFGFFSIVYANSLFARFSPRAYLGSIIPLLTPIPSTSLNSRHGFRRAHSSLDRVKKQNGPDLQVYVYVSSAILHVMVIDWRLLEPPTRRYGSWLKPKFGHISCAWWFQGEWDAFITWICYFQRERHSFVSCISVRAAY